MSKPDDDLRTLRSLSSRAAAWLLGVSMRLLRDCADAPRNDNGRYNAQELVAWHVAREARKRPKLNGHATEDDLLFDGAAGSPALERWRTARADLAEIELSQRRQGLVSVAQVRGLLMGKAAIMRRLGEDLARAYGNGAVELLDQAITDMAKLADREDWLREADG